MSIYTRFIPDDIVEANPTVITTGLWSSDVGSLPSGAFLDTANLGEAAANYYLNVYNLPIASSSAEVQFAVAYGHIDGGGAPTLVNNQLATLPTKAIYSQYKNLLLDPSDTKFSFNGVDSDHIYVINVQRARIREQLDPGNWELPLSGGRGIRTFIDDSGQTLGALTANSKAGRVFNVVSGSLNFDISGSKIASSSYNGIGYGLVYPDLGIIVLNPNAIGPDVGFFASGNIASPGLTNPGIGVFSGSATADISSSIYDASTYLAGATFPFAPVTHSLGNWGTDTSAYNHAGLFVSIKNAVDGGFKFKARSAETISSTHYFVRLRNKEYNYSNNPTFYTPETGVLVQPDFRNDPKVYITTVGLYNDNNELLAVAKLSKPVRKSFDEELLLRVRLDF